MHTPERTPLVFALALLTVGILGCAGDGFPDEGTPLPDGDAVAGNLVLVTANGAWCWYQDERVLVDTAAGKIVLGSVAHGNGVGGAARNGDVDVSSLDLQTGERRHATLRDGLLAPNDQGDDHMAPALWQRPDGRVLAMYAGHNNDFLSRYRRSRAPHDITAWGAERTFDWDERIPGGSDMEVTYSNLLHLSAEDRLYNFARTDNRSPNVMVSDDGGETWTYGGKLTYTEEEVGYVNGYFKYATNGVDRIHFVATEHHPRDFSNSIYHGYVEDSASYASDGTLVDENIFDEDAPPPDAFTEVFGAGTVVAGDTMTHAWTIDLHLSPDGRPYTVFQTRANGSTRDHRFFYARYDGSEWQAHHLGQAGPGLDDWEQDYIGLIALDPNALNTVYASTPIDPRSGDSLGTREIFKGVTPDRGASWEWTALTQNSEAQNLRPVVPDWDSSRTAVFWQRGRYQWQHDYDAAIVGLIDRPGERRGPVRYHDATPGNTRHAGGGALAPTGPSSAPGPSDDRWHERSGPGNGGSVLAAGAHGAEDAPALRTTVAPEQAGTYDVWAYFWADPAADWRLRAGLAGHDPVLARQISAQRVASGAVEGAVVEGDSTFLYQTYVGRATVPAGDSIAVRVDDHAPDSGGPRSDVGGAHRTWYDGLGVARVQTAAPSAD
jgi:hypothetical protein